MATFRRHSASCCATTLLPFLALTSALSSTPYGETTRNVATQILQGTGPVQVDLNKYNLPSLDDIEKEWSANLVQKVTEKEAKAVLGAKSNQNFADTVVVTFPREKGGGLGLDLEELVGREDGLGITLVRGLVDGGSALRGTNPGDILPGDSIAEVAILRQKTSASGGGSSTTGLLETVQEFSAPTECCSYDATVAAIQSLPAPSTEYVDTFRLKLKRLRRRPKVKVNLKYPPGQGEEDNSIELFAGEQLRYGMLVRGVKLNDPLAKRFDTKNGGNCGAGGLCRTCAVSITNGGDLLNPQRVAEKQMLQDNPRWRLACKAIVGYGMKEGEMTIRVNPRQWD